MDLRQLAFTYLIFDLEDSKYCIGVDNFEISLRVAPDKRNNPQRFEPSATLDVHGVISKRQTVQNPNIYLFKIFNYLIFNSTLK